MSSGSVEQTDVQQTQGLTSDTSQSGRCQDAALFTGEKNKWLQFKGLSQLHNIFLVQKMAHSRFFFLIYLLYIFIFGCIGSSLLRAGFSLRWLLLLRSTGSRHAGFSSCGLWAQQLWLAGSRAQAQQLRRTGLVASRHVGSSRTRARTRVPCIGRRILNHCVTREVPPQLFRRESLWLILYINPQE